MAPSAWSKRLAVCSWSLKPQNPRQLAEQIGRIGVRRVQLALDPIREGGAWLSTPGVFAEAGIEAISGMMTTVGEDYSTPQTIQATGGVVPDATWPATWRNIQAMARIAEGLGLRLVTLHAGFLPEDEKDPSHEKLVLRLRQIADLFGSHGLKLGFETGQERAATLIEFLQALDRKNVGVNFDPANLILYDMDDPVQALRQLMPHVFQVHLKDGRRPPRPGVWGEEVPVGTGEVDWAGFFGVLKQAGYAGDLCIEREAGDQREADIAAAARFVADSRF